jgi:hypothetical protein
MTFWISGTLNSAVAHPHNDETGDAKNGSRDTDLQGSRCIDATYPVAKERKNNDGDDPQHNTDGNGPQSGVVSAAQSGVFANAIDR